MAKAWRSKAQIINQLRAAQLAEGGRILTPKARVLKETNSFQIKATPSPLLLALLIRAGISQPVPKEVKPYLPTIVTQHGKGKSVYRKFVDWLRSKFA